MILVNLLLNESFDLIFFSILFIDLGIILFFHFLFDYVFFFLAFLSIFFLNLI